MPAAAPEPIQPDEIYSLVRLPNGKQSVFAARYAEKMHPGLGPAAEAELLYVRQLQIPERMRDGAGEFVVWDIGLGAAANALAVLRATRDIARPLRLVSFDNTAGPLEFALKNAGALGYFNGYEPQLSQLLASRDVSFQNGKSAVDWSFHRDDFPALLQINVRQMPGILPAPHAILFDAFSPAKNPAMWTLPLFADLFRTLDPQRPCSLTTYSRSTLFRVTLLLAGFFVGSGVATGMKEETTVATNDPRLIRSPLDRRWLERARRSDSAEPLSDGHFRRMPLSEANWERLLGHPQFG